MELTEIEKRAYAEIDEFLSLLPDWYKEKIPEDIKRVFKENKDQIYQKHIDPNVPIKEQNLLPETLALIAGLNLEYWATPDERDRLTKIYEKNDLKWKLEQYQILLDNDE